MRHRRRLTGRPRQPRPGFVLKPAINRSWPRPSSCLRALLRRCNHRGRATAGGWRRDYGSAAHARGRAIAPRPSHESSEDGGVAGPPNRSRCAPDDGSPRRWPDRTPRISTGKDDASSGNGTGTRGLRPGTTSDASDGHGLPGLVQDRRQGNLHEHSLNRCIHSHTFMHTL